MHARKFRLLNYCLHNWIKTTNSSNENTGFQLYRDPVLDSYDRCYNQYISFGVSTVLGHSE